MMSKKAFHTEITILNASKGFCCLMSLVSLAGIFGPFVIAVLADEPETMAPLLKVVSIIFVSFVLLAFFGASIDRIDSIIRFRKNEYNRALIQERLEKRHNADRSKTLQSHRSVNRSVKG